MKCRHCGLPLGLCRVWVDDFLGMTRECVEQWYEWRRAKRPGEPGNPDGASRGETK
jgi:hypothetical protein